MLLPKTSNGDQGQAGPIQTIFRAVQRSLRLIIIHASGSSQQLGQKVIMKYTTVKISEILKHPTKRMDAKYWIKKNKKSCKPQAPSNKRLDT